MGKPVTVSIDCFIPYQPDTKSTNQPTLLVVTTRDLEQIALEFVTEGVAGNLYQSNHQQLFLFFFFLS